jgi:predicted DNA-binding transcriptional regulator AlpA
MTSRRLEKAEGMLPARYISSIELAEMLGVPLLTVYQWRSRRVGPPGFRIGRHVRYDPRAVSDWIASLGEHGG